MCVCVCVCVCVLKVFLFPSTGQKNCWLTSIALGRFFSFFLFFPRLPFDWKDLLLLQHAGREFPFFLFFLFSLAANHQGPSVVIHGSRFVYKARVVGFLFVR